MSTPKIVAIEAEQFKRLRLVRLEVRPEGLTIVAGNNAQGKSSVLDAIEAALGGGSHLPDKPVRKGAEKARVVVETDALVITRTFSKSGTSNLTVKPKSGATAISSPQAMLDQMLGTYTFDPLAFANAKPKDRVASLLEAAGLSAVLAALDAEEAQLVEQRTAVGREEARVGAMVPPGWAPKDLQPMDASEMLERAEGIRKRNAEALEAQKEYQRVEVAKRGFETRLEELRAEIGRLERNIAVAAAYLEGHAADANPPMEKEIDIRSLVDQVQRHNESVRVDQEYRRAAEQKAKKAHEYAAMTRKIEQVRERRREALEKAPLPGGLTMSEDGDLMLNGVVFSQASASERIRASVAVGLAQNPALRLMLVRDGSLLDAAALEHLARVAAEHGAQVLVERVGTDAMGLGVVIEDGEVVG